VALSWLSMSGMLDGISGSVELLGTLARRYIARAFARLAEVLDGDDPRAAVEAARELFNRRYGTALLPIAFDANGVTVQVETSIESNDPEAKLNHRVNGKSWSAG
jgi:hypothetical protein